jgi:hypothetical protein
MKCPSPDCTATRFDVSGGSCSTLMCNESFIDEKGYHSHDPNTNFRQYFCNNGHKFTMISYHKCRSCDYNQDRETQYVLEDK